MTTHQPTTGGIDGEPDYDHPDNFPDASECPICGEWRDAPTVDCANCGWGIRPCGDTLGLCVYATVHDGPHKFGRDWLKRLRAALLSELRAAVEGLPVLMSGPGDLRVRVSRAAVLSLLTPEEEK